MRTSCPQNAIPLSRDDTGPTVSRIGRSTYLAWITLLSVSFAACTVSNTTPVYQAQSEAPAGPKIIVVVPADVQIMQQSFGGAHEDLTGLDNTVSVNLGSLVAEELTQHGYQTRSPQFDHQDTQAIRHAYGQLSQALFTKQFTLGKATTPAAWRSTAEYAMFVRFRGFTRTGGDRAGEVAKSVAIDVATLGFFVPEGKPNGTADLDIAMVRGDTGDVLWWQHSRKVYVAGPLGSPNFDRKELSGQVSGIFEKFPSQ